MQIVEIPHQGRPDPGGHFTKKRASFQSELAFSFTTVCRKLASFSKKLARFLRCFTKLLAFCDPENMYAMLWLVRTDVTKASSLF